MKIKKCSARKIVDSRAEWTIEVEVETENAKASASVPQGKSTGEAEAVSLPADQAMENVNTVIADALVGVEADDLQKIDEILIKLDGTANKSRLGANAILGVSMAMARVIAKEKKVPLWQYLREIYGGAGSFKTPRLFANCINGGVHAGSGLLMQEYVVAPKFGAIKESVEFEILFYEKLKEILVNEFGPTASEVGDEGGFAPKMDDNLAPLKFLKQTLLELGALEKAELGIDAAASNIKRSSDELRNLYRQMKKEYNLLYIEDPFEQKDVTDFVSLKKEFSGRPMIIGDDLTTTDPKVIAKMAKAGAIDGVIIKPNQIGSVSETLEAVKIARKNNLFIIVSHRSGETTDDFISDLAWAVGADGIKLGAPARGERVAKYNRLLQIEEDNET